ncbi:hypothetical protein ALC62_02242 [Cyphomyrmex costatus]|uniref:Tudor domain-containing protein n=1 Tax=Cyphomyrmex costatus TaxID=456900 RepID=A0A195D1S8_9HYME|nr:hypothetical protein ALC62_02242 [Cyphomyrmex costatus]
MEVECVNTRLLARSPLTVTIVKVDSLSLFWAQLKTSNEDFRELLEDLTRRMTRKGHMLRLLPDHIIVGEAVAIREGRGWQRGVITDVDWGRSVERPCFEVYILEDRFRQMRWQGISCGLAYIAPFSGSSWSRKAKDLTKFLINQQEGHISILRTVRDEGALVELKIRSGGNAREYHEINFKETLIKLGYARHSDKLRTGSHPFI